MHCQRTNNELATGTITIDRLSRTGGPQTRFVLYGCGRCGLQNHEFQNTLNCRKKNLGPVVSLSAVARTITRHEPIERPHDKKPLTLGPVCGYSYEQAAANQSFFPLTHSPLVTWPSTDNFALGTIHNSVTYQFNGKNHKNHKWNDSYLSHES